MNRTWKTACVVLGLSLCGATTIGCAGGTSALRQGGHVTVVRRGAYSGELALSGSVIGAHYAAELAVLDHCQGRARFVEGAEAQALAVDTLGDDAKSGGIAPDGSEPLHYVCVSRAPSRE
jgi:hypothetical protein